MGIIVLLIICGMIAFETYNIVKVGKIADPYRNMARNQEIGSIIFSTVIGSILAVNLGIADLNISDTTRLVIFVICAVVTVSGIMGYHDRGRNGK